MKRFLFLLLPILCAILFLSIIQSPKKEKITLSQAAIKLAPSIGNPNSNVHMVVFEDLTCESCTEFHERIFPLIKKMYIDTGKITFNLLPIVLEDKNTELAAGAYCNTSAKTFFSYIQKAFAKEIHAFPNGCDYMSAHHKLKKAEKLQERFLPYEIITPYIVINNKPLQGYTFTEIKRAIEKW